MTRKGGGRGAGGGGAVCVCVANVETLRNGTGLLKCDESPGVTKGGRLEGRSRKQT